MLTRVNLAALRTARPSGQRAARPAPRLGLTSFSPRLEVKLLILQSTPFCNIDCSYCYLPDRDLRHRMSLPVVEASIRNVVDSGLLGERLCIVWHSGEPLAAGREFYRDAFACIDAAVAGRCPVRHSIQTNALLIDEAWCELFARHAVRVGVSVDGPGHIHDRHRRTRDGRGTHAQAMRGVGHLRRAGLAFHAIAVATAASLPHADEIFRFFLDQGFTQVGFNIDEREGAHRHSSIGFAQEPAFAAFLRRMLELSQAAGGALRIRELEDAQAAILHGLGDVDIGGRSFPRNGQVLPLEIVSVDHGGNFSTFSPELLGQRHGDYHDFVFGNVLSESLACVFSNAAFRKAYGEIVHGVERCRRECDCFELCGGGAPANKLYENGSFDSAETGYCRSTVKAPLRVMLDQLERTLQP
jgi:uncharacterized protein